MRWSPRSPATPTSPTAPSRPRCSRCWATPTTRAPRSRRSWPAPTSRRSSPTTWRASPTACRRRCATPTGSTAPTCAHVPFTTIDPGDRARLRRRGRARAAAQRRHAPVGRGRRRLALRARGLADRRRGAQARVQHLPAEPGDPDAARAAVGAHLLAGPRGGPAGDGGAHRPRPPRASASTPTSARRSSTRGRGSTTRASRRRWAATRAASGAKYEPFLPALRRDGLAGAAAAGARAGARLARLRHPRAVRRARPRRSAAGARHPQVAPRSGRAAGLLDDRGVHARRQRGGGAQLPRARRRHASGASTTRPIAPRLEEFAVLAAALRHRDRRRRRAHAQGAQARARAAQGPPGREAAVVPDAALAEAGDLRRRQPRALRAGLAGLPALHVAHPPLPGPHRAPAAEDAAGGAGQAGGRVQAARRRAAARSRRAAEDGGGRVVRRARGDGGRARGRSTSIARSSCATASATCSTAPSRASPGSASSSWSTTRSSRGWSRIDALSDDYYVYDEPSCRLVGRRSGRTFALGDAVKVEVQSVSVARRKVDFALPGTRPPPRAAPGAASARTPPGQTRAAATERAQPERPRGRQDKRRA